MKSMNIDAGLVFEMELVTGLRFNPIPPHERSPNLTHRIVQQGRTIYSGSYAACLAYMAGYFQGTCDRNAELMER